MNLPVMDGYFNPNTMKYRNLKITTMKIIYNIPIEVNQKQYNVCMNTLSGIVAGRVEDGKYYIKVLLMRYKKNIKRLLNNYQE
jgi:hypothetical protein